MITKYLTASLSLVTIFAGAKAYAEELPVNRGSEIDSLAGNCGIGPFGQTGKAGQYNRYCTQLTDAEKCLALVKQSFSPDSGETRPSYQGEKTAYCLDLFRNELLRNQ